MNDRIDALKAAASLSNDPEAVIKYAEWILAGGGTYPELPDKGVDLSEPRPGWVMQDSEGDFWKVDDDGDVFLWEDSQWNSLYELDESYAPYTYVAPIRGDLKDAPEEWTFEIYETGLEYVLVDGDLLLSDSGSHSALNTTREGRNYTLLHPIE